MSYLQIKIGNNESKDFIDLNEKEIFALAGAVMRHPDIVARFGSPDDVPVQEKLPPNKHLVTAPQGLHADIAGEKVPVGFVAGCGAYFDVVQHLVVIGGVWVVAEEMENFQGIEYDPRGG